MHSRVLGQAVLREESRAWPRHTVRFEGLDGSIKQVPRLELRICLRDRFLRGECSSIYYKRKEDKYGAQAGPNRGRQNTGTELDLEISGLPRGALVYSSSPEEETWSTARNGRKEKLQEFPSDRQLTAQD